MYCRNCAKELALEAVFCTSCGLKPSDGRKFCQHCGKPTDPAAEICVSCGVRLVTVPRGATKSKIAAGLFGIFLGSIGVHRFYLGFVGIGILQIFVTLITFGFGSLWGFIEGILILTGTFNRDAKGNPLVQ